MRRKAPMHALPVAGELPTQGSERPTSEPAPSSEEPTRTLVLAIADWPVAAAGIPADVPAVVVEANRVIAVSPSARDAGIAEGLRRREAQARCPEATILAADPARDAREFEPVVAAVADLCPRLEVTGPGRCAVATRGPARYFGGDDALAVRLQQVAREVLGERAVAQIGVAGSRFAAGLAAARASCNHPGPTHHASSRLVVPPGRTAEWLAPLPVSVLARECEAVPAELTGLLDRLGLTTLGALAALPIGDVSARFGPAGIAAHRLASGSDPHPSSPSPSPPDPGVETTFDPPVDRVDTAAFAARALAEQLHQRLSSRGETCACLLVLAETEHGERLERRWRYDGNASVVKVAERVRWQLEGWLTAPATARPTAGIALLRLVPEEVVAATGTQLDLWGSRASAPGEVLRAVARLEGLLGPDSVTVPEWRGGRHPIEQVVAIPACVAGVDPSRTTASPPPAGTAGTDAPAPPWPGQLPAPSPATVFDSSGRPAVKVLDADGETVRVDGRASVSAPPASVTIPGIGQRRVAGWAGPWPTVERWWDPAAHRRQARFQVLTDDGAAYLLVLEDGRWSLAASYD